MTNGLIEGCYNNRTGTLRVATASLPCKTDGSNPPETAISWNQVGPQGAKGDTGPVGPQGQEGDPGLTGLELVSASGPVALCPSGKIALSGGVAGAPFNGDAYLVTTAPIGNPPIGWQISTRTTQDTPNAGFNAVTYALCADVSISAPPP